jgi:hypothetical protein
MVVCCRFLLIASLLATIASTLRVYPHQLAYFNELSGGPENGYRHLLHSNLDWGQDYLLVREWLAHSGVLPGCVRVVAYGMVASHGREILSAGGDAECEAQRWEIVSSSRLFALDSSWLPSLNTNLAAAKIGHTTWALPVE